MSTDFWAGYASGAAGIIIGNPLDIIKVRLQSESPLIGQKWRESAISLRGAASPILGYGALNAILFVAFNRTEAAIDRITGTENSLWSSWFAGAAGGLAIWGVSTPTELVKCQAQGDKNPMTRSWDITKQIWQAKGTKGLYVGGTVTALRDSIGYGFYFWTYRLLTRQWDAMLSDTNILYGDAVGTLVCGGISGIVSWASVFPLDVVKTRMQAQLIAASRPAVGAVCIAKNILRNEGAGALFRGIGVCSARAFVVNAVQWAIYESIMERSKSETEQPL